MSVVLLTTRARWKALNIEGESNKAKRKRRNTNKTRRKVSVLTTPGAPSKRDPFRGRLINHSVSFEVSFKSHFCFSSFLNHSPAPRYVRCYWRITNSHREAQRLDEQLPELLPDTAPEQEIRSHSLSRNYVWVSMIRLRV